MDKVLTETKKKFTLSRKQVEYLIPVLHFLATFLIERSRFIFSRNWSYVNEIARADVISDKAELVITYIISKIFAGIIIFLLWKMIFGVVNGRIPKSCVILFGVIYLIGLVVGWFFFPDMFSLAIDNYTTYSQSIRFLPTYWQSIYTGGLYAGFMMIVPHPFAIFAFQWLAFVAVVAYIYCKVDGWLAGSGAKYLVLLFFVLPETYDLVFDAYRNNYYAMLCMFYFAYLFFAARKGEKKDHIAEMIVITVLSAFIMVWRSEGILIGAAGMLYLCLFAYKLHWKRLLSLGVVFICSFCLLSSLQDIGAKKYYGEDYMIINTTDVLYGIFNDPNANLSYEGAEEDLAAIEAVVPVQVLKEAGMTGYRNYNFTMGRPNFNQSLADDETAAAYMAAYYRIISKNVAGYLNIQANVFFQALQIDAKHIAYDYQGEKISNLEYFDYYRWKIGRSELKDTFYTEVWEVNEIRILVNSIFAWMMQMWRELWNNTGINVILHAVAIIADILIVCVEFIKWIVEKKGKHFGNFMLFTVLIGEFAAVLLFMPVGRRAYMFPMLYSSYLLIFLYVGEKIKASKQVQIKSENGENDGK